jgi:membrane protease YdiL (CAAX protease family)
MNKNIPIRFFIITFVWTWLFFSLVILVEYNESKLVLQNILKIFAVFGPAIGAIISIITLNGKNELKKYLSSYLSLNFGWKAWIFIFLFIGIMTFISWITPELFGFPHLASSLPNVYIFPIFWIICIFIGGGQEEIGWRGYILPFLEKKFGYIFGSLILGIIWTVWHIPLFFIEDTVQYNINFFSYMMLLIGYSYFFSWIIRISKNRLMSAVVAHGTLNAFLELFPPCVNKTNNVQIRLWILSIITFIFGISIAIIRSVNSKSSPNVA